MRDNQVPMERERILFICTHNAARSQMAEGYTRARYGDRFEAFSAGTEASTVSPYAVRVMQEIGVDITGQRSKDLKEFTGMEMDLAVMVCDSAKAACPFFPWAKESRHVSFANPRGLSGSEEEILSGFRKVRDEITGWIDRYVAGKT
jgi:arsenate reductase (thioredoxin)